MADHLEFINKLKHSILNKKLPGVKAHLEMAPYRISSIEAKIRNKNHFLLLYIGSLFLFVSSL